MGGMADTLTGNVSDFALVSFSLIYTDSLRSSASFLITQHCFAQSVMDFKRGFYNRVKAFLLATLGTFSTWTSPFKFLW